MRNMEGRRLKGRRFHRSRENAAKLLQCVLFTGFYWDLESKCTKNPGALSLEKQKKKWQDCCCAIKLKHGGKGEQENRKRNDGIYHEWSKAVGPISFLAKQRVTQPNQSFKRGEGVLNNNLKKIIEEKKYKYILVIYWNVALQNMQWNHSNTAPKIYEQWNIGHWQCFERHHLSNKHDQVHKQYHMSPLTILTSLHKHKKEDCSIIYSQERCVSAVGPLPAASSELCFIKDQVTGRPAARKHF